MQVRKMQPEEFRLARMIQAVAFEGSFDWKEELEKSKNEKPEPGVDHWAAFDGEEACACLVMSHFQARFDGHMVGLGGVGGVASLPARRRGGAVRGCIQAALRDLYDHGDVLSALYPFSTRYYRQFGYENGVESQLCNVSLTDLPQGDFGGSVQQLFPGDDTGPLLEVYNAFYKDCNLSTVREIYDRELAEKDLMAEKRWVFLWEDDDGVPGAFCIFGRDGDAMNLRTDFGAHNALLFRDARSLQALFSFIRRSFLSNFRTVRFALPSWAKVAPLLPECANMERSIFFNGMVRAVNAEKLLALCACKGTGTLTLQVSDPMLEENNGIFRLAFREGEENRVERVQAEPDIILGAGHLAALLCGIHTADELRWMSEVTVANPAAPLENVFYHKPCHLPELF